MNPAGSSTSRNAVREFESLWAGDSVPPDFRVFLQNHPELSLQSRMRICMIDQSERWGRSSPLDLEEYIAVLVSEGPPDPELLPLIVAEFHFRSRSESQPGLEDFVQRFPNLAVELAAVLKPEEFYDDRPMTPPQHVGDTAVQGSLQLDQPNQNPPPEFIPTYIPDHASQQAPQEPLQIGRYKILRVLGDGGFGRVYLAQDGELGRNVAIKVPHPSRVARLSDIDAYLSEARIVANLDHSAIVPVYDCGRTADGRCFAVSKFIEGCDLATKLKRTPLTFSASAQLLQRVAEGLHFAHLKGIVHRDIKPGNILLDTNDQPYIADFGIALKEEEYGKGHTVMGTVPYMSPEQLRGEGHLVDGRSDIFSLGVTMYEMLTGRRPFPSNRHTRELNVEPRPPRQVDDSIPQELERICLKALAARVVDRYSTALDFATDLELFLKGPLNPGDRPHVAIPVVTPGQSGTASKYTSGNAPQEPWPAIVPKGLRSFDREDSSFFLQLLPGPRDREGIPESILFWRKRISEFDPDRTFRVGLIYGPSGCGKSSFLKAGVIPRLPPNVTAIYVEATPQETEARLLRALRKHFPELPSDQSLTESLAAIRRGQILAPARKLVIVLDQFEQYLHAHDSHSWSPLLLALRQSDGEHLQTILGVRDDFWMAVTQFMDELEVPFVRGENVAAIDLFNVSHARKVLTAIGQAYSALPSQHSEITPDQKSFIGRAVQELSYADHIIPVHLALFAEMVKDKRWASETLTELGGIAGIGVTFLEETFNGATASPMHRLHQKAARRVLKALLDEGETDIKGAMKSHGELLTISGYEEHPRDFETLLHILDAELRLITPTDPEGLDSADLSSGSGNRVRERFFHLSHDYLVPSLRDWLTRKQKETRRGRAELLLSDRAAGYHASKRARNLPSLLEWLGILAFVPKRSRLATPAQRDLLQASRRYYSRWILAVSFVGVVAVWSGREAYFRAYAESLVDSIKTADTAKIPEIEIQIAKYSHWTTPLLRQLLKESPADSLARLHAAMVMKSIDPPTQETLLKGLNRVSPTGFSPVCDAIQKKGKVATAVEQLWKRLLDPLKSPSDRFRAGLALIRLDPPDVQKPNQKWTGVFPFLADQLVEEVKLNPETYGPWGKELKSFRELLYPRLFAIFAPETEAGLGEVDRNHAATLLGDLYQDNPRILVALILDSDQSQFDNLKHHLFDPEQQSTIRSELLGAFNQAIPPLHLETPPARQNPEFQPAVERNRKKVDDHLRLIRHKAHAAVALLEFDVSGPVLVSLAPSETPDLQSHTEDRLSRLGTKPETLFKLMQSEADVKTQGALIRSLGGMEPAMLSEEHRVSIGTNLLAKFKTHPDSGIHSAAEWFLRRHGFVDKVEQFLADTDLREPAEDRSWYVNPVGETMVVFRGPITTVTGSPEYEIGHESNERMLKVEIPRSFAMATTEVKYQDFLLCNPIYKHKDDEIFPFPESPIVNVSWDWAALYCNHLSQMAGIPADQWCYRDNSGVFSAEPDCLHRSGYRLPTEAEWEHACRSGTVTPFPWGHNNQLCDRYAITLHNSAMDGNSINWLSNTPAPSVFGLFSVCGNVAEIIHENYRKDFTIFVDETEKFVDFRTDVEYVPDLATNTDIRKENGTATPTQMPDAEKSKRLTRGGGSTTAPAKCRSANRTESTASGLVSSRIGFRVVRTVAVD